MKPMISSLSAVAAIVVLAVPVATAQSCAQQASSLQDQQVEAQALADARLALVEELEAAGDAWENAETMRHFSPEQAAAADSTKTEYEALKADLMSKEQSLQAIVVSLNEDVAAYNQRCLTD